MVASLRGIVATGTKEDESSTGRVWAAGLHHVAARSRLARVWKLLNRFFISFSNFFSGSGKPRMTETANTESVDTGVRLYVYMYIYKTDHYTQAPSSLTNFFLYISISYPSQFQSRLYNH